MNIQEALLTKLPFKRKDWTKFHNTLPVTSVVIGQGNRYTETTHSISIEDILANDWEVLEDKIPLTKQQVLHAFVLGRKAGPAFEYTGEVSELEQYLEKLGFK
jgi:hypothetical protein